MEIVKEKNIRLFSLKAGDKIKIEKEAQLEVLWPSLDNVITENVLNNNSLVCKFRYRDFSMLFTGDIEEIAEKAILEKYKDSSLEANILKVAHHGSKSSSTKEFLEAVKPKIALIGVR